MKEFEKIVRYRRMGDSDMYDCAEVGDIVRCKDCKHYERLMHLCRKFDEYGLAESDYCSKGERGENG